MESLNTPRLFSNKDTALCHRALACGCKNSFFPKHVKSYYQSLDACVLDNVIQKNAEHLRDDDNVNYNILRCNKADLEGLRSLSSSGSLSNSTAVYLLVSDRKHLYCVHC